MSDIALSKNSMMFVTPDGEGFSGVWAGEYKKFGEKKGKSSRNKMGCISTSLNPFNHVLRTPWKCVAVYFFAGTPCGATSLVSYCAVVACFEAVKKKRNAVID